MFWRSVVSGPKVPRLDPSHENNPKSNSMLAQLGISLKWPKRGESVDSQQCLDGHKRWALTWTWKDRCGSCSMTAQVTAVLSSHIGAGDALRLGSRG